MSVGTQKGFLRPDLAQFVEKQLRLIFIGQFYIICLFVFADFC